MLVAHSQPCVADGLAAVIANSGLFETVRSCSDPIDVVWEVTAPPDLLLVDEESARRLASASGHAPHDVVPGVALVLLASAVDAEVVRLAIDLSADGVLLASLSTEDILAALEHVARGQGVFPAGWSRMLAGLSEEHPAGALTRRERDVLELVCAGLSNREIAKQLCLSSHTVKFHLRSIYAKLGVRNRVEATRLAAGGAPSLRSVADHPHGQ